jgi:hypothetical protein
MLRFHERRFAFSFNGEFMRAFMTTAPGRRWLAFAVLTIAASMPCFAQSSPQNGASPNGSTAAAGSAPAVSSGAANEAAILKSSEAFVRTLFAWGPDFAVKLGPLSQSATP